MNVDSFVRETLYGDGSKSRIQLDSWLEDIEREGK